MTRRNGVTREAEGVNESRGEGEHINTPVEQPHQEPESVRGSAGRQLTLRNPANHTPPRRQKHRVLTHDIVPTLTAGRFLYE